MGKALVLSTADFTGIAVPMSNIVADKYLDNAAIHDGDVTGFCDSSTGRVRTDVSGYTHKVVRVEGYSTIIVSGWFPIHIGAFYNSYTNIGESTFVSCDGQLTKTGTGNITRTVTIPSGALIVSINLNSSYSNYSLDVNT